MSTGVMDDNEAQFELSWIEIHEIKDIVRQLLPQALILNLHFKFWRAFVSMNLTIIAEQLHAKNC